MNSAGVNEAMWNAIAHEFATHIFGGNAQGYHSKPLGLLLKNWEHLQVAKVERTQVWHCSVSWVPCPLFLLLVMHPVLDERNLRGDFYRVDYVGTDNYVRADPRADISWIDAIQSCKVLRDCDEAVGKPCWHDHVKQELAVAFAVHSSIVYETGRSLTGLILPSFSNNRRLSMQPTSLCSVQNLEQTVVHYTCWAAIASILEMIAAVIHDNSSAQICFNIESFHLIHVGLLWFYANFMMMEFETMTLVGDLY